MIVLRNPVTREKLIESSTQTTNIANISLGRLRPLEIRLPTLHEQSKIVNKVAELFDRCDRLEVSLNDQEKIMNKARKSSIDSISKAVTTQDVQIAWKRIHDNWELVTETSEGIKDLRSLIIELAVKGKLSEQLKADGNASDLLKQIQIYKNEFEKRKSKKGPTSVFEPILADLPQNWIWTSLQEIGIINPRNFAEDTADAGFIPMAHISEKFSTPHSFDIRPWGEIKKGYTHVQNGDVALAKITPCFENGKSTIIDIQGLSVGAGTTEIHVVRPFIVKPEYILLFLNSPFFVFNGIPRMTGTAGQKRLPTDFFASFPFPLPPLLEQERIVERTRSLMRMCDELERNIISSAFIANQLARSVVSASS
jgi:type I restriction enzyme S subunit